MDSKPAVNNKARGTRKATQNPVIYQPSNKGPLPRSKERGLIEASTEKMSFCSIASLPRSKERGLIEAMLTRTEKREIARLPRSKERGLIEARHVPS